MGPRLVPLRPDTKGCVLPPTMGAPLSAWHPVIGTFSSDRHYRTCTIRKQDPIGAVGGHAHRGNELLWWR